MNPEEYGGSKTSPLHRVRLSKSYFDALVAESGLAWARFDDGSEHDGQSGVYLARAAEDVSLKLAA